MNIDELISQGLIYSSKFEQIAKGEPIDRKFGIEYDSWLANIRVFIAMQTNGSQEILERFDQTKDINKYLKQLDEFYPLMDCYVSRHNNIVNFLSRFT